MNTADRHEHVCDEWADSTVTPSAQHVVDFCYFQQTLITEPNTVTARSKVRNIFARSNTGIAGSNPTRGMGVYVAALRRAGALLAVYNIKKLK